MYALIYKNTVVDVRRDPTGVARGMTWVPVGDQAIQKGFIYDPNTKKFTRGDYNLFLAQQKGPQ